GGSHVVIAVARFVNLFDRFSGVSGHDFIESLSGTNDFVGLNFDIGNLPADASVGLMNHDFGVLEGKPLARRSTGKQHGPSTRCQAHAVSSHGAGNHLHCVVDGQCRGDAAAGRVNVEVNIFAAVLALQVKELHHEFVGIAVVNL